MASPRRSASSAALTASQPGLDGASRGLISGALFKVTRESADLTQQDLADALGVDKTTVQAWESGRRPLMSVRTGTAVSLRFELLELGADPDLVKSLDAASEADHLLDRLIDGNPADPRHPLATRVLPQPVFDLLAWPLNPTPPRVTTSTTRPNRRGPVTAAPMLSAIDRSMLLRKLRTAAENPPTSAERAPLVRRQIAYLASFDGARATNEWLAELRASVRWSTQGDGWSPQWAEARSIAVGLGRQGNPDALARFVDAGRDSDSWETANLNYWAYWVGETNRIERDDSFMASGLGRWRGLTLLDHLTARIEPGANHLTLNVHTVWSLLLRRRNLLEDDAELTRSLALRVGMLLDAADVAPRVRTDLEQIRSALALAQVHI